MTKPKKSKSIRSASKSLYSLEVKLEDGLMTDDFWNRNPLVSRTIKIRGSQTLETLHEAIFDAFDREDEHLYEFEFSSGPRDPNSVKYFHPFMFDDQMPTHMTDAGDVTDTTIGSLQLQVDQTFLYMFDYGDCWWHKIKVLATDEEATGGPFPKVTKRVGESPPQYDYPDEEDEAEAADEARRNSTVSIEKLPQIADPNIEQILEAFLVEQRKRLKPNTVAKYEQVISLLQSHLNGYAYEGLSKAEHSLFERYFEAEGDEHREFCQLFGPDKIIENVGSFFSYFMIRKVMASAELKRSSGTVVKKLSKWLAENGYVSEESAEEGAEWGSDSARDLPKAEKASEILYRSIKPLSVHPDEVADEDWMEYDQHPIVKIEPGKLWLEVYGYGEESTIIGPLTVPKKATDLLQDSWDIGCTLARIKGNWRFVEVGEIYP